MGAVWACEKDNTWFVTVALKEPEPTAVTLGIEVALVFLIGTVVALVAAFGTVTSSNTQLEAEPAEVTFGIEIAVPNVGAVPLPPLAFEAVVVLDWTP